MLIQIKVVHLHVIKKQKMYTISRSEFQNEEFTKETLRDTAQTLWEQGNKLYNFEVKKNGKTITDLESELR